MLELMMKWAEMYGWSALGISPRHKPLGFRHCGKINHGDLIGLPPGEHTIVEKVHDFSNLKGPYVLPAVIELINYGWMPDAGETPYTWVSPDNEHQVTHAHFGIATLTAKLILHEEKMVVKAVSPNGANEVTVTTFCQCDLCKIVRGEVSGSPAEPLRS